MIRLHYDKISKFIWPVWVFKNITPALPKGS